MTNEEREDAIKFFNEVAKKEVNNAKYSKLAIEALEQQPCEDCISRQEAINCVTLNEFRYKIVEDMKTLPSVAPKENTGHCKDCKWWKDNDGVYRRGVGAESRCPINRKEVYEGNGYCFIFESQESENKE